MAFRIADCLEIAFTCMPRLPLFRIADCLEIVFTRMPRLPLFMVVLRCIPPLATAYFCTAVNPFPDTSVWRLRLDACTGPGWHPVREHCSRRDQNSAVTLLVDTALTAI